MSSGTLRTTLVLTLVGTFGQWACSVGYAQQPGSDGAEHLQEVVVTATKRESTVQETPISITAVSGDELAERGLTDFTGFAQSVPGVSFHTSGPGQTEFEMRGMANTGGASATVGFYLDDTPLTALSSSNQGHVVIDPNLYDLNRVEVLRGPQGTLYGSGSMGGTIKVIANAPNADKLEASAQSRLSDTDGGGFNHDVNAMLNLPIIQGLLALRLVGSLDHQSGWIDRVVIAEPDFPLETNELLTRGNVRAAPVSAFYRNVNDESLSSGRAGLLWTPSDRLILSTSYFYQRISQDGLSDIDTDPGTAAHYQPFDVAEPVSDEFNLATLNVKYHFDTFDVTSTTSRWTRNQVNRQDGSEQVQYIFSSPTAIEPFYTSQGGLGPTLPATQQQSHSKQFSQEVRLSSAGKTRLQWLIGYFYGAFSDDGLFTDILPGASAIFGTANFYTNYQPNKLSQNAAFGESTFEFLPGLKGTLGLRWFEYSTQLALTQSGAISATGSDATATSTGNARNSGLNPKLNLSYDINSNAMVYGTASKGFRPGGGNLPVPTAGDAGEKCEAELQQNAGTTAFVGSPFSYGPDNVWSYELGEKAQIADSRVRINGAVYFENWKDVQQGVGLACGFGYTANAGEAHVYGGELEISALLIRGLTVSVNGGYTNARIVKSALGSGIPDGTPLQNVPDWTSSQSIVYKHSLGSEVSWLARIDNDYVAGHLEKTIEYVNLPSYDLTNLRLGIEGDRWSAALFANNLFNKTAFLSNAGQLNFSIPTFARMAINQPLTIGLDLVYRFGR